jgi:type III restriction enzyme
MSKTPLHQEIKVQIGSKTVAKIEIPAYITDNLKYSLFDWQKDAIRHFLAFNESEYEFDKPEEAPFHLLFNMATGTGKTLLMAGLILYYYKKGYRNFIFFVNQNNIVDKTENNFIDKNHTKYLFNQNIVIDEKNVKIKKVETFSNDSDNIEIKFTSIHKLHNDIYTVRENAVYLEDLQKRDIIMLGDEAHHLNADTKKKKTNQIEASLEYTEELSLSAKQEDIEKSWENTVINKILHKDHKNQGENRNVLLEFTATIPEDEEVQKKYQNKIIFSFDLKEFLKAWYTKEINLISSSFERKERILQALLLNWYRHKIATENNIANFKGVILFRSKDIVSSKEDFEAFHDIIENLSLSDFDFLKRIGGELTEWTASYDKWISRIKEMVKVIQGEWILGEAIQYIQYSFKKENCIITNSEDNKTQKEKTNEWQEKLLNSLENHNNHIRAIFTVQRLTEWWDVLNLFDIVRLYEKQNTGWSSTKWKTPTTSEVQLIGRGVRYFPFDYGDTIKNKRKFDDDLEHPLRILEELFYHSDNDSKYISDLKSELKKEWYIQDNKTVKTFKLKQEFKETDFYKNLYIALNNQIDNPNRRKITLEEIKRNFAFEFEIATYSLTEEEILLEEENDNTKYQKQEGAKTTIPKILKDFDYHIFRKAIAVKSKNDNSIFQFERLKEELKIESVDDLLKDDFLGSFAINIVMEKWKTFEDIIPDKQLSIVSKFLDDISAELKQYSNPYNGDEFKLVKFADNFFDKEKMVDVSANVSSLEQDLINTNWYVLNGFNGSSEEEHLIRAVMKTIWNLQDTYDEVYLLRNEEVLKIYDFKTGTGFQPDFLLFLKEKWKDKYYQIFIEPKGTHLLEKDEWKNVFLKEITSRYGQENTLQFANDDYVIIGLPLYNKDHSKEFDEEYVKLYQ